jgi:hypothetical protein
MTKLILAEAEDSRFLYKSWLMPAYRCWTYRDWQVAPSQDRQGWWVVTSRLIRSNEDGDFIEILDIEEPLEFRSHAEAVEWVMHDNSLPGRLEMRGV